MENTEKKCAVCACAKNHKKALLIGAAVIVAVGVCMSCCKTKIGVVDLASVRENAAIYKTILAEEEKFSGSWKGEFQQEQEALAKEDKELAAAQKTTKAAAFKKKLDAFQKKVEAFQQKYQAKFYKISTATQAAMQQADEKALELMNEFAGKKGYKILLPKQMTLYSSDCVDVTDDFVKAFDAKKITVQYPNPDTLAVAGR